MPIPLESDRRAIVHYIAIRCPTSGERTVHSVAETSDAIYIRCCDCGLVRKDVAEETGITRKRRQTDLSD